ncbi:MAG: hypothetical protein B7733_14975 [Myxococcales bacterium FL481]|nr:MAG: hypothetical protein B7733_14975 [Myxococcales bacterium FL481]
MTIALRLGARCGREARSWWRWLCRLWVVLGWLLPVTAAADDFGVVTIDLRPRIGGVPNHVCVVSRGPGPRTRTAFTELLAAEPAPGAYELAASAWGRSTPSAGCDAPGSPCAPVVELAGGLAPADLHAACTADTLAREVEPDASVVVLLLEHPDGAPPRVESLRLTGGVVTVGIDADLRARVVTARTLGGHFVADRRSHRAETSGRSDQLIVMPVEPRCHWFDVHTPHFGPRESQRGRIAARAHGVVLPAKCVGSLTGTSRWRVAIPIARGTGAFQVELVGTEDAPRGPAFVHTWSGAWPDQLELHVRRLGFSWRPPACLHRRGTCPAATLDDGVSCQGAWVENRCEYVCPGGDLDLEQTAIDVPNTVTFEHPQRPGEQWSEILRRPGQRLRSYLPPEAIDLEVDVSAWAREVPGARISHLEVLGNDGESRRYAVMHRDRLWVHVPGASCEPVRYVVVGDRDHLETSAPIRDGQLQMPPPSESARVLDFNFSLLQGGGLALSPQAPIDINPGMFFVLQGQLAASFRPRRAPHSQYYGEFRLGGHYGQWGHVVVDQSVAQEENLRTRVLWMRLLFEPAIGFDITPFWTVSAGVALGSSWPPRGRDRPHTGRFRFLVSPSVDLRVRVRPWLRLVAQGRLMFAEALQIRWTPSETSASTPVYSLIGMYGAQVMF